MNDIRCTCNNKLAEYDDYHIEIMCRKCKKIHVIEVRNGKITVKETCKV